MWGKQVDAGERGLERADDGVVLGRVVVAFAAAVGDDLLLLVEEPEGGFATRHGEVVRLELPRGPGQVGDRGVDDDEADAGGGAEGRPVRIAQLGGLRGRG